MPEVPRVPHYLPSGILAKFLLSHFTRSWKMCWSSSQLYRARCQGYGARHDHGSVCDFLEAACDSSRTLERAIAIIDGERSAYDGERSAYHQTNHVPRGNSTRSIRTFSQVG